jgi:hypothetical protein
MEFSKKNGFFVQAPAKRVIQWVSLLRPGRPSIYDGFASGLHYGYIYLPFPYVIFWERGVDLCVALANQFPQQIDDLFPMPLPNIHGGGRVCLGEVGIKENIEQKIDRFWQTRFVFDYEGWPSEYLLKALGPNNWINAADPTQINWPSLKESAAAMSLGMSVEYRRIPWLESLKDRSYYV